MFKLIKFLVKRKLKKLKKNINNFFQQFSMYIMLVGLGTIFIFS